MFLLKPSSLKYYLVHQNQSKITLSLAVDVNALFPTLFVKKKTFRIVAPLELCGKKEEARTPTTNYI